MAVSDGNVLVFGASGGVGRVVAKSASERGAKVWLAMRDTNKAIPGLNPADEEKLGFTRIQADLTSPSSLTEAVTKSGSTIAFVYTIPESKDRMRSTFEALKEAGILHIVILSSFLVPGSLDNTEDLAFIPKFHAETERQLQESGIKYTAVRPAYFNTNFSMYSEGIKKGRVDAFLPETRNDYIAPEDVGEVVGALLTQPNLRQPVDGENGKAVYLCGPKMMSLREALATVASVLGRDITVEEISEEQFREKIHYYPEPIVQSVVGSMRNNVPPNTEYSLYEEGAANLRKYAGREPTAFVGWVEAHKDAFE